MVLFEMKGNSDQISVKRAAAPRAAPPRKAPREPDKDAPVLPQAAVEKSESPAAPAVDGLGDSAQGTSNDVYGVADGLEVSAQERYRLELQAMLEKKKQYPLLAKRLRQQGKVLVKFTLQRDGRVVAAELISTSEYETLNKAARELITQISGLKPFPDEVKKQQWVFVLPVEYRM